MNGLKRTQYALELAGARVARGLARFLGPHWGPKFGAFVGWKVYRIFRIRRRVSIENIRRALPEVSNDRAADRIACASYMNLARDMVHFVQFDRYDRLRIRDMVEFENSAAFSEALERGRGAILFTGHFGNWELLGAAIAANGYPIQVLVGRQSNPLVDRLINDLRRSQVSGLIDRDKGLKQVFRALSNNQFVAIVGDQDAGREGTFVEFLGRPASTARGPALFAVRCRSPIIAGFIRRKSDDRYVANILPPMWPDPSLGDDDAVVDLVQRYSDALADAVRAHPTEYLWAHRRWKSQSP